MDNRLLNIGDAIIIDINSEVIGEVRISSFQDYLNNVTNNRSVLREFRVQIEGMFWTEWEEMTFDNLSARTYISNNVLRIQVRYTRTGTETSGYIEFERIEFGGSVESLTVNMPTLYNSVFANIVNSLQLDALTLNLFKKLYYRGIVAQYIERAENSDYYEDRDYIDLFSSIAKFFALLIRFYSKFEDFDNSYEILLENLKGYNVILDENNTTIENLRFLNENLLAQINNRGTRYIFSRLGKTFANGRLCEIDGEFVRLTQNKFYNELLFENIPKNRIGWCLGNSSPLYRGTQPSEALNKTGTIGETIIDEDYEKRIETTESGDGFAGVFFEDPNIIFEAKEGGSVFGIGRLNSDNDPIRNYDKALVCDTQLDYEISFSLRIEKSDPSIPFKLLLGVDGFNKNGYKLNDAFVDINYSNVTNMFYFGDCGDMFQEYFHHAVLIVHAYSSRRYAIQQRETTNLNIGNDLKFNNPYTCYFIPKVLIDCELNSGERINMYINNYKVRPLVRGKNILPLINNTKNDCFSMGFIQCANVSHTYYKNNNKNKSQQEIDEIVNKYLYPFNLTNLFTVTKNQ